MVINNEVSVMIYRQTKQRQEVLDVIRGVNHHMTADEVYQEVIKKNPNVGIATVYRNLNRLVELEVISRIVDKDISYFDGNGEPHHHLRCVRCGKYQDAPLGYNSKWDKQMAEASGIEILGHSITFDCICKECSQHHEKN